MLEAWICIVYPLGTLNLKKSWKVELQLWVGNAVCPSIPMCHTQYHYTTLTYYAPHSHQHTRWPVDVMELLDRFCCWTRIWLDAPLSLARTGYWRYRNLIDWLINYLHKPQTSYSSSVTSDPELFSRSQWTETVYYQVNNRHGAGCFTPQLQPLPTWNDDRLDPS